MTSQSPADTTLTGAYAEGWAAVNQLVREGASWSGRETDNAFLNLGNGSFADISGPAGLDFADDARAFAPVDWDHDGDLDLWVVNRTAPQVRFLRNDVPTAHRSIALRLVGRSVNRDAIGARVDLEVAGRRLVGIRHAGSGYISQSSMWLHFGVGEADTIDEILVSWPDGSSESFRDVASGVRYELLQGSGDLRRIAEVGARGDLGLVPSEQLPTAATEVVNLGLTWRLPFPPTTVADSTGRRHALGAPGPPRLVNLWASWCPSCRHELGAWVRDRERLEASGLEILALAVDEPGDWAAVPAAAEEIGFWFPFAPVPESLLQLFELVQSSVVDRHRRLAVPTSFLFDRRGRLARIYKGPVEIDRLLAEVGELELTGLASARASLPFAGRWHKGPHYPEILRLAGRLLDQSEVGAASAARFYLTEALRVESADPENQAGRRERIAAMLGRAGEQLLTAGERLEAIATLRQALAVDATSAPTAYLLGKALFDLGHPEEALGFLRQATASDPTLAEAWHTLGVVLTTQNLRAPALAAYERALEADPSLAPAWLALGLHHLIGQEFRQGTPAFRRAVALDSDNATGWTGLGTCLCSSGEVEQGAVALAKAIELDPDDARAREMLTACSSR